MLHLPFRDVPQDFATKCCPVAATSCALTMVAAKAAPTELPRLRTIDKKDDPTPKRWRGRELINKLLFGV